MSNTKGRNSVSKTAALTRARLVIDATLTALVDCPDEIAARCAASYQQSLAEFDSEKSLCSSPASRLLNTVKVGRMFLGSVTASREPFVRAVAVCATLLCDEFLREYVPRPDRPQGSLINEVRATVDKRPGD